MLQKLGSLLPNSLTLMETKKCAYIVEMMRQKKCAYNRWKCLEQFIDDEDSTKMLKISPDKVHGERVILDIWLERLMVLEEN